jgi:hypothetical protein
VEGNIHFTFDLWTSSNLLCLNGVFAHYLDAFGKKKKILLSIPSINDSHTGENIAQGVADIIMEFGLEKRVGYFVLDNAANNDKAIELWVETLASTQLNVGYVAQSILSTSWPCSLCMAKI